MAANEPVRLFKDTIEMKQKLWAPPEHYKRRNTTRTLESIACHDVPLKIVQASLT